MVKKPLDIHCIRCNAKCVPIMTCGCLKYTTICSNLVPQTHDHYYDDAFKQKIKSAYSISLRKSMLSMRVRRNPFIKLLDMEKSLHQRQNFWILHTGTCRVSTWFPNKLYMPLLAMISAFAGRSRPINDTVLIKMSTGSPSIILDCWSSACIFTVWNDCFLNYSL